MSHETALTVIDSALVDVAFAPDLSLGEFRFRIDPSEKPFVQEGYVWDPNSGIPEPPPGSVLPDWLIRDSRLENVRFWVEAAPDSQSVPEKLEALAKDFSALLDRQGNCGSGDLAVHPETRGGLMNLVAPPAMAIALKLTPCPEDGGAHAEIYDWCAAKLGNVLAETLQRLPPTESRVRNLDVETYIVN